MIIPATDRATEAEITAALIEFLKTQAYGEATFKRIFDDLWRHIKLSPEDRGHSEKRRNELLWHTVVRNIGAHKDQSGNAVHDGILLIRKCPPLRGGGYQLASKVKRPLAIMAVDHA